MKDQILKIQERKFRGDTEVVSARLPKELVQELTYIASETGRSRNEIVEICLSFAVNRVEIEKAD